MADKKVTELDALTSVTRDDLLMVVNDPQGTPASRKVSVKQFFSNVSVTPVFTERSIFSANVEFNGSKVLMNANLVLVTSSEDSIEDLINDRMQVANTNTLVADRMQVANTNTLVADRMQVANVNSILANTNLAVADRMQVANAEALLVNPNLIGATRVNRIQISNTVGGLVLFGGGVEAIGSGGTVPASSNAGSVGVTAGAIWYSNNYLYIATSTNTIKRVALSDF